MAASHCIFIALLGLLLTHDLGLNDLVVDDGLELGQQSCLLKRKGIRALNRIFVHKVHIGELYVRDCGGPTDLALDIHLLEGKHDLAVFFHSIEEVLAAAFLVFAGLWTLLGFFDDFLGFDHLSDDENLILNN